MYPPLMLAAGCPMSMIKAPFTSTQQLNQTGRSIQNVWIFRRHGQL